MFRPPTRALCARAMNARFVREHCQACYAITKKRANPPPGDLPAVMLARDVGVPKRPRLGILPPTRGQPSLPTQRLKKPLIGATGARLCALREAAMTSKVRSAADQALEGVLFDGMSIMAGGFGLCGIPENLIAAIRDAGTRDLTVI